MKIQLKKYGTKKNAVLLFPGWTYPVENEALFLKELTKKYCCYTIHLPGYSDVPEVDQNYSFEDFAKKLHEILHSQQISPVAHIGFSMGCRMVMTYEQLYPTSVKKILVGCPFEMSIPAWGIFLLAHEGLLLGLTRTYGLQKAV
ncbi:MAG: alpha/beta fold hydrolase, partial [Microgenomates group bacterium]